jgi:ligand-binding sensor protein
MNLTDVQPLEQWVALEEEIVRRSGLDANVFNVEGIRISTFKSWANRLCPAIKATDKGQSFICAVAHMNVAAMARQQKRWVLEECDAGLIKLVVPIFVKGEFVGAVGACGCLLDEGEVDSYMIYRTSGIEEETIESLSEDICRFSLGKAEELAAFITSEVDHIIEKAHLEGRI